MTNPQTILVTTVDISVGAEEEFNHWYNDVHMPEVMACPGFRRAARFECVDGQPRYMAIYELDSPAALTTPEMQRVRGWGDMFAHVRNFHERVYTQFFTYESQQSPPPRA
jgi:hypothetical protein